MFYRMPVRYGAIMLLTTALLQSCAQMPERTVGALSGGVVTSESPELGDLSQGDIVEMYEGVLAPFGQVTIGREYFSASGRVCKEILSATGSELVSIACLLDDDGWYTRKPLNSPPSALRSKIAPLVPAQLNVPTHATDNSREQSFVAPGKQHINYQIQENETLWSFSKRVTGNALNWKTIAQYNNIDDVSAITSGEALAIPVSIINSGS